VERGSSLRLKVTAGSAAGTEISVDDELLIGRNAEGEGNLGEDIEISRRHALISRADHGGWTIEDLGSRNGTMVNGHRLQRPQELGVGDTIEVGGTTLVVQITAPATPPDPGGLPGLEGIAPTVIGRVSPLPGAAPDPVAPTESAEPEPPEPAAPPPRVVLRLELDLAEGEALLSLEDGSDRVRLAYEDGAWRIAPEA
jgi:pSer/pThr/pTyr-binding forkhead associated (FHA) protein